jgi:hypothetical protein
MLFANEWSSERAKKEDGEPDHARPYRAKRAAALAEQVRGSEEEGVRVKYAER